MTRHHKLKKNFAHLDLPIMFNQNVSQKFNPEGDGRALCSSFQEVNCGTVQDYEGSSPAVWMAFLYLKSVNYIVKNLF
ncbi:hypothetical protein HK12_08435 [Acetobacter orientalis]|uniref:Uncharacterized protein n=1 Tax=Acetobacter orientalis TaxID=146474 RepID=A0A252A0A5_9PROT|nr:hypothetical protein HK12_08435 [Acetobacter orientalis]